jgi:hypothetical protein
VEIPSVFERLSRVQLLERIQQLAEQTLGVDWV